MHIRPLTINHVVGEWVVIWSVSLRISVGGCHGVPASLAMAFPVVVPLRLNGSMARLVRVCVGGASA